MTDYIDAFESQSVMDAIREQRVENRWTKLESMLPIVRERVLEFFLALPSNIESHWLESYNDVSILVDFHMYTFDPLELTKETLDAKLEQIREKHVPQSNKQNPDSPTST